MKDYIVKKTTGMKANTVDELSADYEQLGTQLRKQTAKEVISSGGPWASVAFKFKCKNTSSGEYESERVMLASFKNMSGMMNRFSYFNIKNKEEARKVCAFIKECFDLEE